MNAWIYNLSTLVGVLLVAIGAGLQWGIPSGLMAGGVGVLCMTVRTAEFARGG